MISQSLTEMVSARRGTSPSESVTALDEAATTFASRRKRLPETGLFCFCSTSLRALDAFRPSSVPWVDGGLRRAALATPAEHHQLRALYGKGASTFLANAGVSASVWRQRHRDGRACCAFDRQEGCPLHDGVLWRGKQTNSQHIAARNLINADEIMRLPDDRMILLRQGAIRQSLTRFGTMRTRSSRDCSSGFENDAGRQRYGQAKRQTSNVNAVQQATKNVQPLDGEWRAMIEPVLTGTRSHIAPK